jgi:acetaldehyde dehydrogenase (acetylating)
MGTLGAIGMTTGLMPSLTLGSGGVGGSITGDNVTAYHLINIKRLAYEMSSPPLEAFHPGSSMPGPSPDEIEHVVRRIVNEILESKQTYL